MLWRSDGQDIIPPFEAATKSATGFSLFIDCADKLALNPACKVLRWTNDDRPAANAPSGNDRTGYSSPFFFFFFGAAASVSVFSFSAASSGSRNSVSRSTVRSLTSASSAMKSTTFSS